MDKRSALKVLIENSYVLTRATKDKLLAIVDRMSEDDVAEWGKLFVEEQTFVAENQESILARISSL